MKKRTAFILIIFVLLLCVFPTLATADGDDNYPPVSFSGTCGDLVWKFYNLNGLLLIEGDGQMPSFPVTSSFPWENLKYSVKTLEIKKGVTSISEEAFRDFTKLTSVSISDSISFIGSDAFSNCTGLSEIYFPDSVTNINTRAFYNCSALTSVCIPGNSTTIGMSAFQNCTSLSSLIIGDGVKSIGPSAFKNCTGMSYLSIPCSTVFFDDTFNNCTCIQQVQFTGSGECTWGHYNYISFPWYNSRNALTSVIICDGITSIPDNLFRSCVQLTSATIPGSVTEIGKSAFQGCTKLESITIGNGVNKIGDSAFYQSGLKSIIIPDGVVEIDDFAFCSCHALTSVTLPCSAKIDETTFVDCKNIFNVHVTTGKGCWRITGPWLTDSRSVLQSVTLDEGIMTIGSFAFTECISLTSIAIPESVTAIGDYAFATCKGLTSIIIPEHIESIGKYAFSACTEITSIVIPDSVIRMGEDAIAGCISLETATIGNGLTKISKGAFEECSCLKTVIVSKSISVIEASAFAKCSALEDVYFHGSRDQKISIGESNDYLVNANWHYDKTLVSINLSTLPSVVTFTEGEAPAELNVTGGKLKLTYDDDGTFEEINLTNDMISGYNPNLVGKQTIIVTYEGKETTFEITIEHIPGEPVRENVVPATTMSQGTYDEVVYCSICHAELSREHKTTEKLPVPPTIKTQPKNAKVKSGSKAKFAVKAKEKDVSYQWFSRSSAKDEWKEMKGETKDKLNVVGTGANNGWQYRCRLRNKAGGEVYSNIATLTVTLQKPVIKTQPKNLSVKSGKKVKFSVKASGKNITYQWFTRANAESEWQPVAGGNRKDLNVVASKANNGSQYYCYLKNADGDATSAIVTLTVTPEAPTIKTQPKDAKVKIGAKAKFKVKASGKNVTYQWYYRTSEAGEWVLMEGQTTATLTVTATADKIGWQFRCLAKNADGQAYSKVATLLKK